MTSVLPPVTKARFERVKIKNNPQLNGDLDLEFIMVRVGGPEATTKRTLFHFERKGKGKDRPKQSRVMV